MSKIDTANRLLKKKFGVFMHFLKHQEPEGWNQTVENFDVQTLSKNLRDVKAGWFFITLMQGRCFMCAPNKTFDRIAGTNPGEACSKRDLPMDLVNALYPYDIDLGLYYTGDGPHMDPVIGKKFGFTEPREIGVTQPFVGKWSSVLEEYALRYGKNVKMWWIDGCYKDYFKYTEELVKLYSDACHKGNPDCLVALNTGVFETLVRSFEAEDMTSGEFNFLSVLPEGRYTSGAQSHILAPIGAGKKGGTEWENWCSPGLKFSKQYLADFVRRANQKGCLVTIDVAIDKYGHINEEQLDALSYIAENS